MELRKHIGRKLKHFRVLEGTCYHKGYYFLIFGNMKKGTSRIVKLKAGKEKEVIKVSKTLHIGHGNDCCVRDGVLLVTHSGKSNAIHRIDAKTLEKMPDAIVTGCSGGFNAICCFGKGYLVKKMASKKVYVLDDKFRKKGVIRLSKTYKLGQGMAYHDGKIYRAFSQGQSHENYVCVYDSKGKLIKKHHYDHVCEIEDVMIVGGQIKVSIYRKVKKKGKTKSRAYIRKLK
ncbi:hypothetical protein [Eubacterium sp. AB3007]|uniref:hypothetical protein n=1 Tax=Eubacterium sp. AB3007 TaxID=1392487 RepID=UPI0004831837|nr:hypothetical protein [Eubacterium sp. AB3007]